MIQFGGFEQLYDFCTGERVFVFMPSGTHRLADRFPGRSSHAQEEPRAVNGIFDPGWIVLSVWINRSRWRHDLASGNPAHSTGARIFCRVSSIVAYSQYGAAQGGCRPSRCQKLTSEALSRRIYGRLGKL